MRQHSLRQLPKLSQSAKLLRFFSSITATIGLGCATLPQAVETSPPMVAVAPQADEPTLVQVKAEQPQAITAKSLPINLDTVLRLAEGQNTAVAVARGKVEEAFAEKDLAAKSWLPSLYFGTAYYRHEGGVSNPDGSFTHASFGNFFGGLDLATRYDIREVIYQQIVAERSIRVQRGEMRRVSTETMLEAATTYIDILAARTGELIAESLAKDLEALLARAKKLAKTEPGTRVEVARIQTQVIARQQIVLELREQAARASAKLAYLIGVDPATTLVPADERLVPLDLVDATPPAMELAARALRQGPGIAELESLIALVHESQANTNGLAQYLPIFEMRMAEGGFGTGVGASSTWDNRWDLALQMRWNLSEGWTKCERDRLVQAKANQAHLAMRDLQAKLSSGVHEAREAILSGKQQIKICEEAIEEARKAVELSQERLNKNVEGSTQSEVLLQINALALSQVSYLNCLRNYDKAQLRLMVLLGSAQGADPACPSRQLP